MKKFYARQRVAEAGTFLVYINLYRAEIRSLSASVIEKVINMYVCILCQFQIKIFVILRVTNVKFLLINIYYLYCISGKQFDKKFNY